jgi:hypothetical protein
MKALNTDAKQSIRLTHVLRMASTSGPATAFHGLCCAAADAKALPSESQHESCHQLPNVRVREVSSNAQAHTLAHAMHCKASLSAILHNSPVPAARLPHACNVSCMLPVALITPSLHSHYVIFPRASAHGCCLALHRSTSVHTHACNNNSACASVLQLHVNSCTTNAQPLTRALFDKSTV